MRLNLKIGHKGFILVAVPLVFLVTFVAGLSWLQNQAEQEALRFDRSRQIIAAVQGLEKAFFDASMTIVAYGVTTAGADKNQGTYLNRVTGLGQRCDELLRRIPELLAEVKQLSGADPSGQAALGDLEASANRALLILVEGKDAIDRGDKDTVMSWKSELQSDYESMASGLAAEIHRYVETEKRTQRTQAVGFRALAVRWIYGGVAGACALSLVLILFFSKEITQRLAVLAENTRRVTTGDALQPPIGGTDEIAYLDQAFHDMATALAAAREKERELDRLKQEFVAIVSHDLRTPLTSVQGGLELLETGAFGVLSDKGQKLVANSQTSIMRLMRLINDLLDAEKLESGNFSLEIARVDLQPVLERSVDAVRQFADRQGIQLSQSPTSAVVNVDGDRIEQVMINLLSNAIKYSPQGKAVAVSVEDDGKFVTVRVKDEGRGIPESHRQVIFERFKQVEIADAKEKKGTGLGLAICKSLIEQHGGAIGVDSQLGVGSTFWFRLPLA